MTSSIVKIWSRKFYQIRSSHWLEIVKKTARMVRFPFIILRRGIKRYKKPRRSFAFCFIQFHPSWSMCSDCMVRLQHLSGISGAQFQPRLLQLNQYLPLQYDVTASVCIQDIKRTFPLQHTEHVLMTNGCLISRAIKILGCKMEARSGDLGKNPEYWMWIGCGTGMLFIHGAAVCRRYIGDGDCKTFWQQKVCKHKAWKPIPELQ